MKESEDLKIESYKTIFFSIYGWNKLRVACQLLSSYFGVIQK